MLYPNPGYILNKPLEPPKYWDPKLSNPALKTSSRSVSEQVKLLSKSVYIYVFIGILTTLCSLEIWDPSSEQLSQVVGV